MKTDRIDANTIMALKENPFRAVSLAARYNDQVFRLNLITRECIEHDAIVSLLSRWRKENEFWFQAIFPVSDAGTKIWLKNKVIEEKDRLLFLITIDNKYIGHVGLWKFDFANHSCEIDNIVRGEKDCPGIMYPSLILLQDWARETLAIKDFYLHTLVENHRAVKLYEKLGYETVRTDPLIRTINGDRIEWVSPPADYSSGIERHEMQMRLIKKEQGS